jgi:hypothetical protein
LRIASTNKSEDAESAEQRRVLSADTPELADRTQGLLKDCQMLACFPRPSWEKYIIIIVAAGFLIFNINWGLPNQERNALLLGAKPLTDQQIQELNAPDTGSYPSYELNGEPIRSLRSFIVAGVAIDEPDVYSALAHMNPGRLDLNPRRLIHYGGTYLYMVGLHLFVLKSLGLLNVTRDFYYHLQNPYHVCLSYTTGRWINIAAFLGTLFLLGKLGDKLGGRIAGTVAMLTLAFSTATLDMVLVGKPHVYASFWVILSICLIICYREKGAWGYMIGGSVAAGWAAGASLAAGAAAFFFPILLWNRQDMRNTINKVLTAWAIMAVTFILTNPYVLIDFDNFVAVVLGHRHYVLECPRVWQGLKMLFLQGYCFPLGLVALLGMIHAMAYDAGLMRRMAGATACMIVSSLGLLFPRYAVFLGPLICLFAGYGLARFLGAFPKLPGRLGTGILIAIFLPGFLFASMWARDVIWDEAWKEPVRAWTRTEDIYGSTIGVFNAGFREALVPHTLPPFPFVHTRIIVMDKYKSDQPPPDYVLVSNIYDAAEAWASHPLRSKYVMTHNLGFRESYGWFLNFRVQSQSCVACWVYKRADG